VRRQGPGKGGAVCEGGADTRRICQGGCVSTLTLDGSMAGSRVIRFLTQSLRGRYLAVAISLGLITLITAWSMGWYVSRASRSSTAHIEQRYRILQESRGIRDAVWQADFALQSYALSPDSDTRATVHRGIAVAIQRVERLRRQPDLDDPRVRQELRVLRSELQKFDSQAAALMQTRVDVDELFPAIGLARTSMLPKQIGFYTAANLAMREAAEEHGRDSADYRLFEAARYTWSQMIAAYRLYLINRLASLGEVRLTNQAEDVEQLYAVVQDRLVALQRLKARGRLGLQGSQSLEEMQDQAAEWQQDFTTVVDIARSDRWRTDIPLFRRSIEPLLGSIWEHLQVIDEHLMGAAAADVSRLAEVAASISHALWVLSGVAMLVIVFGFRHFERRVLRPMTQVARALKNEAMGRSDFDLPTLPAVKTWETQNLIDAFSEMRRQVHSRQRELEHQALHDALTNLPNRTLLQDRLQQSVVVAQREGTSTALLIMDLDRFKEINDTLGHHVGDLVLQQVGARLTELLRESDTVARLGGDEFAILLPGGGEEGAERIARKTLNALERVLRVAHHNLYVGGSIGIALSPEHGTDVQTLMQRADVAMYVAKRKNVGYSVYSSAQDQYSVGRLALVSELRSAINTDQLELHYQPKLDVKTGRMVGVEALLRWDHPVRGNITPEEIIPVAEQTGLIKLLTLWVLERAIRQTAEWRRRGLDIHVAVNLSVWNLHDPDLERQIAHSLDQWELPPERLVLEITESATMADPHHALETLLRLDAMGMRLSIDDFGTGFSSLAYLKKFPVDELKIDKSFVIDTFVDENDAVIVRSTIDLAHNLGLEVVAEGVEEKDVFDMLYVLGCDIAQGHYFSRPLAPAELFEWAARLGVTGVEAY